MAIDIPFIWTALTEIVKALPITMMLTLIPLSIGFLIGLAVALIRVYEVKGLTAIANGYVSFLRGTPIIMHIMIIYFGLPLLIDKAAVQLGLESNSQNIPIIIFVLTALSLSAGAYLSEVIRSGISSISKGQAEAAYSVGMNTFQTLFRIILPQALAQSIPNFTNIFIGFLHTSSIAFIVSQKELTGAANIVASTNLKFLEAFIAAGIIYWVLTILVESLSSLMEKKATSYTRGGVR
ncbi:MULTISPECIES: amino acid ABC transporter permease [Bacillus]|uniref:Cysteine ABC transporter permease n=2 Tax=Bacillus TaxID=1386 RepID=A0A0M4FV86_9BACI|nr:MULTISPECIES: amino acid ABC transporter permease [Bacillus]ALC80550.1 cysteine ABC transporter permease [Bacillus gobiensis]MBP1083633.1 L-cystine transport system permease protein [Bacillus capparidis]MED1094826.1 amino acid ABC transporter permease [Bacillus capparidis]